MPVAGIGCRFIYYLHDRLRYLLRRDGLKGVLFLHGYSLCNHFYNIL